jgi:hypothetical protein
LRGQAPAADASAQPVAILTDQLAAMPSKHQEAQAVAVFNAERARLAEWDAGQLRGQLGLAQQDLARVLHDLSSRANDVGGNTSSPSKSPPTLCLRVWAVPAQCMPHLATEAPSETPTPACV